MKIFMKLGLLSSIASFITTSAFASFYENTGNHDTKLYSLGFLNSEDLGNFSCVNHYCKALVKDQRLRLIQEGRFVEVWQNETIEAARTGVEPEYLKAISALYKVKIDAFIYAKENALREQNATRAQWQKHAFSVLFTLDAAWSVAYKAADFAAYCAVIDAAGDAARTAAGDAARTAAWSVAYKAANFAARYAARTAAWSVAYDAAKNAAWYAARSAAGDAARSEITSLEITGPQEIGRLAYRVAEKVSSLYFLQHAEAIFEAIYQASMNALPANPDGIFDSAQAWAAHKQRYLAAVLANPDQAHFIQAWADHLDRIASMIDADNYELPEMNEVD